ncbi:MAG: flagellar export protein FliJ [Desulfovibrio sp.]|jgi:flagellar FliJ protein|nr:flagellar export protein FliJ [Desulfovibrio sp.]
MAPFRFRLEQVLRYRKRLEEEAMLALAGAVMHRDALASRLIAMEEDFAAQRQRLCRAETLAAPERMLILDYSNALALDIEQVRQALNEAEEHVDRRRVEVVRKAKDRGVLDSLKDKQAARHRMHERQQEQQNNDETATLRYKPAAV